MTTKAKVYEGVACLEIPSPDGGKWWYQGTSLSYTPVLISDIKAVRVATLKAGRRQVLTTALRLGNQEHMVVFNLPRSDISAMKRRGLIPPSFPTPHETTAYMPWPSYTENNPNTIKL